MHAYSTDESRVGIYIGMALLSVILAWTIVAVTSRVSWPQWLVSAPSMGVVFVALYAAFDRWAWRWQVWRSLSIVGINDLSGTYNGTLTSTYKDGDGNAVERDVTLQVVQKWTRIKVEMTVRSGTSSSMSTSALGAVSNDGTAACLTYVYKNKVNPGVADADMGDHDGAADLRIYPDGRLSGRYFNSRPRAGTITATKSR